MDKARNVAYRDVFNEFDSVWRVMGVIATRSDGRLDSKWTSCLDSPWDMLWGIFFPLWWLYFGCLLQLNTFSLCPKTREKQNLALNSIVACLRILKLHETYYLHMYGDGCCLSLYTWGCLTRLGGSNEIFCHHHVTSIRGLKIPPNGGVSLEGWNVLYGSSFRCVVGWWCV